MGIELAQQIFNLVLVPLFGILVVYIIKYLNAQRDKITESTNNVLIQKYIGLLNDIIITCVIATNQTYVDSLKEKNAFTAEAQKEAFEKTFETVKSILSEEMVEVLSMVYEDLDLYITEQIESMVHTNKSMFNWNNGNNWQEQPIEPSIDYTYTE